MADDKNQFDSTYITVKNPHGKYINCEQRLMAYNVYKKHLTADGKSKSSSVQLTATDTGISQRTLWKVVKEMESEGCIRSPPKKRNRQTLFDKLEEEEIKLIRQTVHEFFERNEIPTLDKVFLAVDENEALPPISRTSLWKILKKLGFCFEKRGSNHTLITQSVKIV